MQKPDPYLKAAIMEVVENQLRDNKPPETRQTFARLLSLGIPEGEAKQMIGRVVVMEIFEVLKRGEEFNHSRFVAALDRLPDMPEEG